MEGIKENYKRYLISSAVTFVSAFLLFAMPQLLDDNFVWTGTAVYSVVLTAVRVGVKAVWEVLSPKLLK